MQSSLGKSKFWCQSSLGKSKFFPKIRLEKVSFVFKVRLEKVSFCANIPLEKVESAMIELQRKATKWLMDWKKTPNHRPALIWGIRQCGKTYSIRQFAKQNYKQEIYLNFWRNPNLADAFAEDLTVDGIVMRLSAMLRLPMLEEGNAVFVFDEVQDCPSALLSLKSFAEDGRYDVIASGSYLGINGYNIGDSTPRPVGYVDRYEMKTLDFEEFLWNYGYDDSVLEQFRSSFRRKEPLPASTLNVFEALFRQYMCVGGFPEAVKTFLETKNLTRTQETIRGILRELEADFGRRKDKNGFPVFKPSEVARIRNAFSLIPSFLAKENKRFVASKIEGKGDKSSKKDAISYLIDSGIVFPVHNLEMPSLPLSKQIIASQFKLFPTDIGLAVSLMEPGTLEAIMRGDLGQAKGALYECLVAEAIHKAGGTLFYFAKDTGLEIDFVISYEGAATLLEVKAKDGRAKAARTILAHPEHYGPTRLIYVKAANLGESDGILTIPHFMSYLLAQRQDVIIEAPSLNP